MYMKANALRAMFLALALALATVAATALAQEAPPDYIAKVNEMVHKAVIYPRIAKMREQEGTVAFNVKIDGAGAVTDAAVEATSGNTALDNAALDAAKNAAPFPAPPGGGALVHLKVAFSLN